MLWIYAKILLGKRLLQRIPSVSSWKCFRAEGKPEIAAWGWYTQTLLKTCALLSLPLSLFFKIWRYC